MSSFKNLGGLALLSDAHAPKTFSKKKAEENTKNIFTYIEFWKLQSLIFFLF